MSSLQFTDFGSTSLYKADFICRRFFSQHVHKHGFVSSCRSNQTLGFLKKNLVKTLGVRAFVVNWGRKKKEPTYLETKRWLLFYVCVCDFKMSFKNLHFCRLSRPP